MNNRLKVRKLKSEVQGKIGKEGAIREQFL
jgi:hypothetical protein